MTASGAVSSQPEARRGSLIWSELLRDVTEELRILIVGGVPVGVLIAGVGSRLAMMVLRFTSPGNVVGVISDDGFRIGEFTLSGTYNLLLLGAAIGFVGAAAYRGVSRWLLGPVWFRRATTGLASAAVVGSLLVHADGVDFVVLGPKWLAVGLFVALPGVFGLLIGPAVDAAGRPGSWAGAGRRRWALPAGLVVLFPFTLFLVAVGTVVLTVWMAIRRLPIVERMRAALGYAFVMRAGWLAIALAGLVALVRDIAELA